ncbi:hypothetical protein LEP1GSC125_0647 [Leptospira mayottensis 200901122]|uniref:Uncharacterized protein n=1 Tax=Leptospira mayottensis 200901122 TaxID=1193010 RepID=A0AA87SXR9_9LEPT|nr:hypothetical protein LEP1GSC125_0647 [Leptospira mayottensis 200901122]
MCGKDELYRTAILSRNKRFHKSNCRFGISKILSVSRMFFIMNLTKFRWSSLETVFLI